jgi:hypothetical protein
MFRVFRVLFVGYDFLLEIKASRNALAHAYRRVKAYADADTDSCVIC